VRPVAWLASSAVLAHFNSDLIFSQSISRGCVTADRE
jgi:hypothetical protein